MPNGPLALERWKDFAIALNTLSKSAGLGSPRFERVRDLGCLSCVVRAERLRT
jgi:hypothetical protein